MKKSVCECVLCGYGLFLMLTNIVPNKRNLQRNAKELNSYLTFLTQYLFFIFKRREKKRYDTFSFFLWPTTEANTVKLPLADRSVGGPLRLMFNEKSSLMKCYLSLSLLMRWSRYISEMMANVTKLSQFEQLNMFRLPARESPFRPNFAPLTKISPMLRREREKHCCIWLTKKLCSLEFEWNDRSMNLINIQK